MNEPLIRSGMVTDEIRADFERVRAIPIADPRMKDDRREIHEERNEAVQSAIEAFVITGGMVPLGNHYHKKKTEIFFILSGGLERLITDTPTSSHRREFIGLLPGTMIVMPPGVTHTLFFNARSTMICYATECFDPEDSIPLKLV